MKLQTIEIDGCAWAIVPMRNYDELREALEDLADHEALREAQASGEELFPSSLAERLWSGANPVRVWREYRGLSVTDLAQRAKVSNSQLSAIERGSTTGSIQTLCSIADVLEVTLDDLAPANRREWT